jgi:xanthine dehydrogenase small subunit
MTRFLLNGSPRTMSAEPGRTVLDHLRLHERLTGTKEGCAEGDCGACTVVIGRTHGDGMRFHAVNSCIMLAADLDGCLVITAEGVAPEAGKLGPVQAALVEFHGSQCGFCTPGFVTSFYAYTQVPEQSQEAALDAFAGNLCRCTGYRPIMAAAAATPHRPDARIPEWRAALAALPPADESVPQSLAELDAALAARPDATLTAGTTDLGVGIAKYGNVPAHMISLRGVAQLRAIAEEADGLVIGATATYSDALPFLERYFPNFAGLVRRIGSVQIRNVGTMGANLCNASPIGDSAPCLIALGARLTLRSAAGEREVAIDAFFTAYRKTMLRPGEYLKNIRIPYLAAGEQFFAYKLAKRFDQDISTVAAGFFVAVEDGVIIAARAGFGGMAATPLRATKIEAALIGRPVEAATFAKAAAVNAFTPISDVRASADYRSQAASGLVRRLGADMAGELADVWAL